MPFPISRSVPPLTRFTGAYAPAPSCFPRTLTPGRAGDRASRSMGHPGRGAPRVIFTCKGWTRSKGRTWGPALLGPASHRGHSGPCSSWQLPSKGNVPGPLPYQEHLLTPPRAPSGPAAGRGLGAACLGSAGASGPAQPRAFRAARSTLCWVVTEWPHAFAESPNLPGSFWPFGPSAERGAGPGPGRWAGVPQGTPDRMACGGDQHVAGKGEGSQPLLFPPLPASPSREPARVQTGCRRRQRWALLSCHGQTA